MTLRKPPIPDSANFWNVRAGSEDTYWTAYEATRPDYREDAFLTHLYTYHASKFTTITTRSPSFATAHDVGCGSGVVATALAARFEHVILSDNNTSSLDAARRRLSSSSNNGDHFSFLQCAGEDLASLCAPSSADLIVAAECLPLMDAEATLAGFGRLLKPGGTLAVWFYGRPHFSEEGCREAGCQGILDQILDRVFTKIIQGGGAERQMWWKRAADGMASWLDYLDFPPGLWKDVKRLKWNSARARMGFFTVKACDFEIEPRSCVREGEEVMEMQDSEIWKRMWDVRDIRNFVSYSFPNVKEEVEADREIARMFESLAEAMGGEGEVRKFMWPVVLRKSAHANSELPILSIATVLLNTYNLFYSLSHCFYGFSRSTPLARLFPLLNSPSSFSSMNMVMSDGVNCYFIQSAIRLRDSSFLLPK